MVQTPVQRHPLMPGSTLPSPIAPARGGRARRLTAGARANQPHRQNSCRRLAGCAMKPPPGPDEFDWAAHTEAVAADIFGESNAEMSRPPDDVRFGNHGSVSINFTTGQWYDFEN